MKSFVYNTGLEVAAAEHQLLHYRDGAGYLKTLGPTRLRYDSSLLPGHGPDHHPHGFGSPVGRLRGSENCLSEWHNGRLAAEGICVAKSCLLRFDSGIEVSGTLQTITRRDQRLLLLSFTDCWVVSPQGELLFEPSWGVYDMAVGESLELDS